MTGKFYEIDPWLDPFKSVIEARLNYCNDREALITGGSKLSDFANGHHWYGLHRTEKGWVFREHAPNATSISLVGTFSGWKEEERYRLRRTDDGDWVGEFDEGMLVARRPVQDECQVEGRRRRAHPSLCHPHRTG